MKLELEDGSALTGYSFGASSNVSGELVFQTGMVGYTESLTDPSYRGQILVFTFPLVGNYGVPCRNAADPLLENLPAHFESREIHIAGLVVASYSGENFSQFLAHSSLGAWLKEQSVPAIHGVDTRALTKKIREAGSMLGRLLLPDAIAASAYHTNGIATAPKRENGAPTKFQEIPLLDPNERDLVSEGELLPPEPLPRPFNPLTAQ